ncbi:hypothetical protein H4R18_000582 [Coemansia javaensis]|uniref:DNRLRE domain-containing protein n=1 Tax=Coemansia javaensis TaxID=2761396 RepID=A0A9W8HP56_9FUNG|nr:hypothetical protein H4R18_000582 [Coemansia javaensis]
MWIRTALSLAVAVLLLPLVEAAGTSARLATAKDATVAYTYAKTSNGSYVAYTPTGGSPTLVADRTSNEYRRILLGYTLPSQVSSASAISSCVLNIPRPFRVPSRNLTLLAYSVTGSWDEDTVTAATVLTTVKLLGTTNVTRAGTAAPIDILDACRGATGGAFSVFVDSIRPIVTFSSRNTGRDTFSVDLVY